MLPSAHRLTKDADIKTLFAKGKGVFDAVCGIKYRKNGLPESRFAIVAGHAVSKQAVTRNQVRRRLRNILCTLLPQLAGGYDVILIVRAAAIKKTYTELDIGLKRVFAKSPLMPRI